ncbi:MAG TPA: hypothetical protein VFQ60_05185 [Patescibacteria group bacterium]|nr:hypothetical protein [Patescibacteria group bacterium]
MAKSKQPGNEGAKPESVRRWAEFRNNLQARLLKQGKSRPDAAAWVSYHREEFEKGFENEVLRSLSELSPIWARTAIFCSFLNYLIVKRNAFAHARQLLAAFTEQRKDEDNPEARPSQVDLVPNIGTPLEHLVWLWQTVAEPGKAKFLFSVRESIVFALEDSDVQLVRAFGKHMEGRPDTEERVLEFRLVLSQKEAEERTRQKAEKTKEAVSEETEASPVESSLRLVK